MTTAPLLTVEDIHTAYGLSRVLFGISLEINAGECVCLLGRNGVGKSTTIRSIMGLTPPSSGRVAWKGQDITGWPPHKIARAGIGFVPEDRRIFAELSVWENLDVAAAPGTCRGHWTIETVYERPCTAGIAQSPGRFPFGRRAADADHRAHADGQPGAVVARRAVGGPCAIGGRDVAAQGRRIARPGADHPSRRAGGRVFAFPRQTGSMCWKRARSAMPDRPRSCATTGNSAKS